MNLGVWAAVTRHIVHVATLHNYRNKATCLQILRRLQRWNGVSRGLDHSSSRFEYSVDKIELLVPIATTNPILDIVSRRCLIFIDSEFTFDVSDQ